MDDKGRGMGSVSGQWSRDCGGGTGGSWERGLGWEQGSNRSEEESSEEEGGGVGGKTRLAFLSDRRGSASDELDAGCRRDRLAETEEAEDDEEEATVWSTRGFITFLFLGLS